MTARRPDLRTPEWKRLRKAVLERDAWRCTACGKELEGRDATVDHVVPYTGPESNVMHNLVALCRSCNSTKQDRLIVRIDWFSRKWLTHI